MHRSPHSSSPKPEDIQFRAPDNTIHLEKMRAIWRGCMLWGMQKEMTAGKAQILLDVLENHTGTVLLFIPGVSGKGRSDRFAPVVALGLAHGVAVARVDMWDSIEELDTFALHEVLQRLDEVVNALLGEGFVHLIVVGKSFGGGLAIVYDHPAISQKIGWAPAFGVADEENIGEIHKRQLSTFESTREIHIGKDKLSAMEIPLGIVHGTADASIPLENSKEIIAAVSQGTLIEIPGADHSFKTAEHEAALIRATEQLVFGRETV